MDKNQLIFSSDCVINFDDLGQFKDFTQDIQNMLSNIKNIKTNPSTKLNQSSLKQILKADPQDTFHAPAFKELISIILQILIQRKQYFKNKTSIYKLLFHNLMEILQQSFISYQFSQDIGPTIAQYIINEGKSKSIQRVEKMMLIVCLSKLSKKLSYIDNIQSYVQLMYNSISEEQIISDKQMNQQQKSMMLNIYSQIVELSLRNRKIRQLLSKKMQEEKEQMTKKLLIKYKIHIWNRNKQKAQQYMSQMQAQGLLKYQVFKLLLNRQN